MIARLRALWRRLREILMARDPFDIPTDWQESEPPETVWPDSGPDKLTKPRLEQVK